MRKTKFKVLGLVLAVMMIFTVIPVWAVDDVEADVMSYLGCCTNVKQRFHAGDICEHHVFTSDPVSSICDSPMSEEELEKVIAEFMAILSDSGFIDSAEDAYQEALNWWCSHPVWTMGPCQGIHAGGSGCFVNCLRTLTCSNMACNATSAVSMSCVSHSWSTGWCGRTCTRCGIVEWFHGPGGCWFC